MLQTVPLAVLLSDAQVTSLLSMGLMPGEADAAEVTKLEALVAQATDKDWERAVLDLQSPWLGPNAGPLSPDRPLDVSEEQRHRLANRNLLDLLTSRSTDTGVLEEIERYGGILAENSYAKPTRLVGVLLKILAGGAIDVVDTSSAAPRERPLSQHVLSQLSVSPSLPVSFRRHCEGVQAKSHFPDP